MQFEYADDVKEMARIINEKFELNLDLNKIAFIRSKGSKSRAIARTIMLPSQWRFVLKPTVIYVVEVISEKFDKLDCEDKLKVVLHELNHIPPKMSGGLRTHSHSVFKRKVKESVFEELCKQI